MISCVKANISEFSWTLAWTCWWYLKRNVYGGNNSANVAHFMPYHWLGSSNMNHTGTLGFLMIILLLYILNGRFVSNGSCNACEKIWKLWCFLLESVWASLLKLYLCIKPSFVHLHVNSEEYFDTGVGQYRCDTVLIYSYSWNKKL